MLSGTLTRLRACLLSTSEFLPGIMANAKFSLANDKKTLLPITLNYASQRVITPILAPMLKKLFNARLFVGACWSEAPRIVNEDYLVALKMDDYIRPLVAIHILEGEHDWH